MPRTSSSLSYADFTAAVEPEAFLAFYDAAPNGHAAAALIASFQPEGSGKTNRTAIWNLATAVKAVREGKAVTINGKAFGNPSGLPLTDDTLTVPMQGNMTVAQINAAMEKYAAEGKSAFPEVAANGNGSGAGSSGNAAPPSTPVTVSGGPMNVDPALFDAVASLQDTFKADAVENAPRTGRDFLALLWEATPEEEKNRRVNAIARSFVQTRESGSHRGDIPKMIDQLAFSLKDEGMVAPDFDIWTYIYNSALPQSAQSESYEQIKANLQNAYRFDPNAAAFRDWESLVTTQATTMYEMFLKDMGVSLDAVAVKIATKTTRDTLASIKAGMDVAQSRFNEWETRRLREATPEVPAAPVLERIEWAALAPSVQGLLPEASFWEMLTPEQQAQFLGSRSIVSVEGTYRTKGEAEALAAEAANAPAPEATPDAPAPAAEAESKPQSRNRKSA